MENVYLQILAYRNPFQTCTCVEISNVCVFGNFQVTPQFYGALSSFLAGFGSARVKKCSPHILMRFAEEFHCCTVDSF